MRPSRVGTLCGEWIQCAESGYNVRRVGTMCGVSEAERERWRFHNRINEMEDDVGAGDWSSVSRQNREAPVQLAIIYTIKISLTCWKTV